MFFKKLRAFMSGGHGAGSNSAIAPASHAAATSVLHLGDAMAPVVEKMDLKTAINARAVCKSWRRLVKEADLEPLEAGCSEQERELGCADQQRLQEALDLENQVCTPTYIAKLAEHLANQEAITAEMRHTLVNWLIEMNFQYKLGEPCLHLTIQLLHLFLANNAVERRKFQTVGVSAFRLGCYYKHKRNLNLIDLSYITDYSSTKEDITDMEAKICKLLEDNMTPPTPADYLKRFSGAAKLESTVYTNEQYTTSCSMTLFFIDMALLDVTLVHTRPSLVAAAAIMCTLRVLGRRDWSAQLEHYTTHTRETVAALAETLIANGRAYTASAMGPKYTAALVDRLIANGCVYTASAIGPKYTSQRLGGVGDQVGADGKTLDDGCLHILADYFKQ